MYMCIFCMYRSMHELDLGQLSPAPVVGFELEFAVDYLYSEPETAVSP